MAAAAMAFGDEIYAADDDGDVTTLMAREPRTPIVDPIPSRPADLALSSVVGSNIINSFFNPSSNPVSPGSPSPALEQVKNSDIVPPTRPSSTPFPYPEHRNSALPRLCDLDDDATEHDGSSTFAPLSPLQSKPTRPSRNFDDLPTEIHECVLDHLFGYWVSATSKSSVHQQSLTGSWGTALRHSRRKELSGLALVSRLWRVLVQERLYRHIKLKATVDSLDQAMAYFVAHEHLRAYVKHVEIWFPVFQPKYGPLATTNSLALPTVTMDGLTNATYILPADNSTLEEAFCFVAEALPTATILTLEGGERKKAPKVEHFYRPPGCTLRALPVLQSVQALVTKGQWNLMRDDADFMNILGALPNLKEWHGSYSKPKSKSYLSMAAILPVLPMNLTHLTLCMESDYRRELTCPPFFMKVSNKLHFCARLAEAAPALEHLAYTGRVCKTFFDVVAIHADPRATRLRSVDLTVKNCCRPSLQFINSGSGIQDMNFIAAFEMLVLAGIRSMRKLTALEFLRIRYVDLDSICPPLNPYFLLRHGWISGVWSDNILAEINQARPQAKWESLAESFGERCLSKDGRMVINPDLPRSRILSMKLSNYAVLSSGVSIP